MFKTLTKSSLFGSRAVLSSAPRARFSNAYPPSALPHVDWNFKTVDIENGERINYSIIGDAPETLVMIHGMFHNIQTLAPIIPALSKQFRLVCIELRGHGQSSYNSPYLQMDDITTDMRLVLNALNIDKFNLYGVSLGGMISLRYAALYPEQVQNLVLLGPIALEGNLYRQKDKNKPLATDRKQLREIDFIKFLYRIKETRDLKTAADGLLPACFNAKVPPRDVLENLAKSNFDVHTYEDMLWISQQFNFTNEKVGYRDPDYTASKVQCPVMVMYGEKCVYLPRSMLEQYKNCLKDKMTLKTYPNSGHLIAEIEPEQVSKDICSFIKQNNLREQYLESLYVKNHSYAL